MPCKLKWNTSLSLHKRTYIGSVWVCSRPLTSTSFHFAGRKPPKKERAAASQRRQVKIYRVAANDNSDEQQMVLMGKRYIINEKKNKYTKKNHPTSKGKLQTCSNTTSKAWLCRVPARQWLAFITLQFNSFCDAWRVYSMLYCNSLIQSCPSESLRRNIGVSQGATATKSAHVEPPHESKQSSSGCFFRWPAVCVGGRRRSVCCFSFH